MAKTGKRYRAAVDKVDRLKRYDMEAALQLLKENATSKFDETVELAARLGVDPRHSDQQMRGTISLPHGTGKTVRVLVFAKGEKEKEAQEAGADFVGSTDMVEKIQGGWIDFDAIIATPDMMKDVGKLGRVLGPRGLMPNPKSGSVTFDVGKAVREVKAGRIQYRTDKTGNIHVPVGRASFPAERLAENIRTVIGELQRAKPSVAKGTYWKNVTLSTTMGPGIRLDIQGELLRL
ncbi:MAG: 50S ribosomal protein L1 [Candidatus Eisenbacteria bacterium]|nr:50S ribosomal protein L1 [Candidatus Eisenbacteria bacterium]